MAAAVMLNPKRPIPGLDDSKTLTAARRTELDRCIREHSLDVAVAVVSHQECDSLGMHQADLHGLRRAVARLEMRPAFVLTDGFAVDGLGVPNLAVVKGDRVAACVSAASIVAKVARDRIMTGYDAQFPGYGFAQHKGYSTAIHQRALEENGPCPIHRMRFANVARVARVEQP